MKNIHALLLCAISLHLRAQFTNVMISNQGSPSEVAIQINFKKPNEVVAGANIDKSYYSANGGQTWTIGTVTSSYGVVGDPSFTCDTSGNLYFFHLASGFKKILCQKSTNGGQTWSNGIVTAQNGVKAQDKEWAVVDWAPNSSYKNTLYTVWAELDNYSSSLPQDSSIIKLSKSTDGGITLSNAVRVSKQAANCGFNAQKGACPAVGPNGEVYVSWCGLWGIRFQKSLDGGNTWLPQDVQVDINNPTWYFTVPGITWGNAFTSMVCDISGGPNTGNLYISWADKRNGTTNTDVFVARSTNGGNTWNTIRVNNDATTSHQFHPFIACDPITGYVYVVFYDRRNYPNNNGTDVYLAWSTDGGNSWSNVPISANTFSGNVSYDYNCISAYNNEIRPVWTANFGVQSVWTALINYSQLGPTGVQASAITPSLVELQNYPNPFSVYAVINFYIPKDEKVSLKVYDMIGSEVANLVDGETRAQGWHQMSLNTSDYNLSSGIYYFSIHTPSGSQTTKVFLVK